MKDALRNDLLTAAKAANAAVASELGRLEKAVSNATGWTREDAHCLLTSPVRQVGDPPTIARLKGRGAAVDGQSANLFDTRKAAAARYRELTMVK